MKKKLQELKLNIILTKPEEIIPKSIPFLLLIALFIGFLINIVNPLQYYLPQTFIDFINKGIIIMFWSWFLAPFKKLCLNM